MQWHDERDCEEIQENEGGVEWGGMQVALPTMFGCPRAYSKKSSKTTSDRRRAVIYNIEPTNTSIDPTNEITTVYFEIN
jgi:hypothetical protein